MSRPSPLSPAWDTSSVGLSTDVSLLERSHLGEHLVHCGALRGPLDQFLAGAEWFQVLVAEHVVTVALVVMLLVGVASLVR